MQQHNITYRLATETDLELYYQWANDKDVRDNSFSPTAILPEDHSKWFLNKIKSDNALLLVFFCDANPVGQLRLDIVNDNIAEIDYSVASGHRGKRLGQQFLMIGRALAKKLNPALVIKGVVKTTNIHSAKAFQAAGFVKKGEEEIKDIWCHLFYSE